MHVITPKKETLFIFSRCVYTSSLSSSAAVMELFTSNSKMPSVPQHVGLCSSNGNQINEIFALCVNIK